jgi:hypothetical protein
MLRIERSRNAMNGTGNGLKSGVWSGRTVEPARRLDLSWPVTSERLTSIFSMTYCMAASMS